MNSLCFQHSCPVSVQRSGRVFSPPYLADEAVIAEGRWPREVDSTVCLIERRIAFEKRLDRLVYLESFRDKESQLYKLKLPTW